MTKNSLYFIAFILVYASSLFAGQIYQWTDSSGKKHFSDSPPPASVQDSSVHEYSESSPAGKTNSPSTKDLLRKYDQRRQQQKQKQKQKAEEKAQQKQLEKHCSYLKKRVQYYDGYRHRRTNEKGEEYYLSDAEIVQEKQLIEAEIRKNCR